MNESACAALNDSRRSIVGLRAVATLLAGLALATLVACDSSKPGAGGPPGAGMPPPEVVVSVVQKKDVAVTFEYIGQIAGVREVEVRPRVSGILQHWNFQEGAKVTAGQSLFTVDAEPFKAALAKSEADLAGAEASLAQAKQNAARLQPLWEAKAVSKKEFDDAVSGEKIAAAAVKSANAAVTEARLNLKYTRVEAPITGITSRVLKSEGSLVQAQQTWLTSISQVDPVHVIFSFTEAEHLRFTRSVAEGRLKLPDDGKFDVRLRMADGSEYPTAGKVNFTDMRVNPATGTIEARAVVANPQQVLRPGQFARVMLSGAIRPDAMVVPQRAVLEGPGAKIVMTVNKEGKVEPRPIEVGDWAGQDWVVTSGLAEGDKVIVDGIFKIKPGAPVRIADAAPAKGAGGPPAGSKPAGAKPEPAPAAAKSADSKAPEAKVTDSKAPTPTAAAKEATAKPVAKVESSKTNEKH